MQTNALRPGSTLATQPASERRAANPNAILSQYKPSGASAATARQDGLPGGVSSSHKMAHTDLKRLEKYAGAFEAAGKKHGVPPALLAAIASRESRAGAALDSHGRGDGGNGFGLMQVDRRYHTPHGGPYSKEHIDQAAGILKGMYNDVKAKHPDWPKAQQLRGAVAAYNSGVGNVQTRDGMDRGTTGNDYSNDVWARAQELAPHFGGGASGASGGTPASGPKPANTLAHPPLQEGSHGEQVKHLQQNLHKLGYDTGKADGEFGAKTEAAVKKFQAKHHLENDGVVGSKTQAALKKALASHAHSTKPTDHFEPGKSKWKPAPSLAEVKKGDQHLSEGMQGNAVKHVQHLLGISADGKYGPGTKKAVADFQHSAGMHGGIGSVGPKTLAAMEKAQHSAGVGGISAKGRQQMKELLNIAQANSQGKRPDGMCLKHVGDYLDRTSYGKIGHGGAPRFPLAHNLGDWLNKNHSQMGIKKLNIDNPYKAPPGSIVVVRAGTPGTHHPTAGDIVVVGKNGHFYNGGEMGYGGSQNFPKGNNYVIGVFAPA